MAWGACAQETQSYDKKMLLKEVFDKSVCKIKILITLNKTLMKHNQNNQKSLGKPMPGYVFSNS